MGYFGSSALSDIKFGSSAVSKVYRGSSLMWQAAGGSFTGFSTGFEPGDTLFANGAGGSVSTARFHEGTQSWLQADGASAATGEYLNTGLSVTKRHDSYSVWLYNNENLFPNDGPGSRRAVIVGTQSDYYVTDGWSVYTRNTGCSLAAGGSYAEFVSTVGVVSPGWHHYYIQIDWGSDNPDKTQRSNFNISIWIDGTVVLNNPDLSGTNLPTNMGTPSTGFDTWRLASSISGGGEGFERNYDKIIVQATDTAVMPISNTTPAAIEAALLAI